MNRNALHHYRRQGAALMVALFLLSVFSIGSGALLRHLHIRLTQSNQHARDVQAHYLAEAGVEKAIAMLQAPGSEYRGEELTPLGEGYFSVTVTPEPEAGSYRVASKGLLLMENMGGAFPLEQRIRGKAAIVAELCFDAQGRMLQLHWNETNGQR